MIRLFLVSILCLCNLSYAVGASANVSQEEKYILPEHYKGALEKSSNFLKYLIQNKENIIGLEYIAAAGTKDSIMSRFGHSLLRFVDNDNDYTNDIVLSFEGKVAPEDIDMVAGLVGDYESIPRFDNLHNFWVRYVRNQNRPLARYIIPSSKEMRDLLMNRLEKLDEDPSLLGNYTFFNKNCAGLLSQLFLDTEISEKGKTINGRVPVLFDKWLSQSLLTPYLPINSISPFGIYQSLKREFKLTEEQSYRDYSLWPDNAAEIIRNKLTRKEIMFLYNELWDLPYEIGKKIINGNRFDETLSYNETVGMLMLPHSFYQICYTDNCAMKNIAVEQKVWGVSKAQKQMKKRARRFMNSAYTKKAVGGSIVKSYVEKKNAFSKNEILKQIKQNYNLLTFEQE